MRLMNTLAAAAAALTLTLGVALPGGEAQAQARSLDELLNLVEQGRVRDSQEAQERIREFEAQQAEQQNLLQQARQRLQQEENRSAQLETASENNEREIAQLTQELNDMLGDLRELFGVVQLVAGDAASQFEQSLTSIQYPGRRTFLLDLADRMGQADRIASVEEIERLWFELQREATANGRVVRTQLEVVDVAGNRETRDVVRVGTFNIVADGRYLRWEPNGSLHELPRQPSERRYINSTSRLVTATDGFVPFALDPTRGQILGLLIETPTLRERIDQGAEIGYLIIALGLLGLLLALERIITLGLVSRKVTAQLKNVDEPRNDNPLGRVLKVHYENRDVDTETLELKLGEAIIRETPRLQRFVLFIKVIAVVAPLMGLLGTVTGMIQTFQAITLFGTGDPTMMAGGISQALVTTVLGLTVAIPMVLLHTIVSGRSRRIVHVLQEQSAGIIAEHSERHQRQGGAA
jgi:biopolymer transport protein ExbB